MSALSFRQVHKSFAGQDGVSTNSVLGGIDLEVPRGGRVAVIGPSGCGKTTLLNLAAGFVVPDHGEIAQAPDTRLAYVFQEPRLLPWASVEDNLAIVLSPDATNAGRIADMLAAVGLSPAAKSFASTLSLGMARRASLARAFLIEPDFLLLDEPFVSLDVPNASRLRRLLLELLTARAAAMLFVTHDLREAIMVADRLVFMSPSPSRISLDLPVPLDADERLDETCVEAFRQKLVDRHELDMLSLDVRRPLAVSPDATGGV